MERPLIKPDDIVTITSTGNVVEVQHMERMNTKARIRKMDKNTYIDLATGELKEFKHSQNRKDNLNSLRQTFKKLRYLINKNFQGKPNELHVTLTYSENMKDTKRLYTDFDKFYKKLKRRFKDTTIDYINVIEPQERGAWHCHLLLRFNERKKIYLDNNLVRELWGQGKIVKTQSLNNIDNVGAYLSAYLSDIELTEDNVDIAYRDETKVQTKKVDGKEKKFIKGGRLHMYPPGMKLFRKSKGIEYPKRERTAYKNRKKIVGTKDPHYTKTYSIENEKIQSKISFEQYNLKRV